MKLFVSFFSVLSVLLILGCKPAQNEEADESNLIPLVEEEAVIVQETAPEDVLTIEEYWTEERMQSAEPVPMPEPIVDGEGNTEGDEEEKL